jgi:Flp pilus assembly protein TadB
MIALLVLVAGLAALACVARARGAPDGPSAPRSRGAGRVAAWWAQVLDDAGVEGDPARWGRVALGGLVLAASAGGARGGGVGLVVVVAVAVVGGAVARQAARGRGARAADARLPDLVEHVSRALRAGHDLRGAAVAAGEVVGGVHGVELAAVVARIDGGAAWTHALDGWLDAHPRRPVQLVAGALAVAEAAGGRAGPALDGVAATLRARAAVADEARALASQARASAAVLVGLPVVVAVGGAAADRKVAEALLGTSWGLACIALAVLLDGVGALWMHRIVTQARP